MRYIILIFLFANSLLALPTAYKLQANKTVITINNSGPLGTGVTWGTQNLKLPAPPSGGYILSWFDYSGYYNQRGSTSNCSSDPCGPVSFNTEISRIGVNFELYTSGNVLTAYSYNQVFLRLTPQPVQTSPVTIPLLNYGRGQQNKIGFSIPNGTDLSGGVRALVLMQNMRPGGVASIIGNSGTERIMDDVQIINIVAASSVCTFTTERPHNIPGMTNTVDIEAVRGGGAMSLNGIKTATLTTINQFTIPCSLTDGNWNYGDPSGTPMAGNWGATVSYQFFAADEWSQWWGGIHGNHQAGEYVFPFGASEFTAGTTNYITTVFNGQTPGGLLRNGLMHGWRAIEIWPILSDVEISSIVVPSGGSHLTATANTSSAHGFSTGQTVIIRNAPEARWVFNGPVVVASIPTSTSFTFLWGLNTATGTAGTGNYDIPAGTYVVPTTNNADYAPQPHMYAARSLMAKSDFVQRSASYVDYGGDAAAGLTFYNSGTLVDPDPTTANNATQNTFSCSGCHTAAGPNPGWDMKMEESPVIRMAVLDRDNSGDLTNANNVVARIRSLGVVVPAKERPWNPPYQPSPDLDAGTVDEWRAGGGLEWVQTYDHDLKRYMCPTGNCATDSKMDYNGNINARQLPLTIQFPHMARWWPRKHPSDYLHNNFNVDFTTTALWTNYLSLVAALPKPCTLSSGINNSTTTIPLTGNCAVSNGDYVKISDSLEYIKITAGSGTSSLTGTRAVSPTGGTITAATSHASGALLSDFTAFANATSSYPFLQQIQTDGQNAAITYDLSGGHAGDWAPSQVIVGYASIIEWQVKTILDIMNDFQFQDMADKVQQYQVGGGISISNMHLTNIVVTGAGNPHTATVNYDSDSNFPNVGVGGHCRVTGATVDANLNIENCSILTKPSATSFTFQINNVANNTYTDAGLALSITGINDRASAQTTRGWNVRIPFTRGPHQSHAGRAYLFFNSPGVNSDTNFNYENIVWYSFAGAIAPGNRLGRAGDNNAWEYTIAFDHSMGINRPGFYHQNRWWANSIQNTAGLNALGTEANNVTWGMMMQPIYFGKALYWTYQDMLTPTSEQQAMAQRFVTSAANFMSLFSTAEWQGSYQVSASTFPLSNTPVASRANAGGSLAMQDNLDYFLAAATYFSADSTAKTTLKNLGNAVFAASGYDYQTAIDRGCTRDVTPPYVLRCW